MLLRMDLTPRQLEVYRYIRRYFRQFREAPTRQQIQEAFGFRSPNAAQEHVMALVRKGALAHTPGKFRGLVPQGISEGISERGALHY
jgi:repressor LexA